MTEKETKEIRLVDAAPSSWFREKSGSSIWVCGYRSMLVVEEEFHDGPITLDLGDAFAILVRGSVKYHDSSEAKIELVTEHQWHFDASKMRVKQAPEGTYLLLLLPHDVDGRRGNEGVTRTKIDRAVGLLGVFQGRNLIYQRIFDNLIKMDSQEVSSFTAPIENPFAFPKPNLHSEKLALMRTGSSVIAQLSEPERNRIGLALRWFQSALFEDGIDAYLKFWIALETLGMPDTSNIRPINETMASAYGISYDEAKQTFGIGRLFGLRSEIVHGGSMKGLLAPLFKYIEALFVDVFFHKLGLPTEKRAESVLRAHGTELNQFLSA